MIPERIEQLVAQLVEAAPDANLRPSRYEVALQAFESTIRAALNEAAEWGALSINLSPCASHIDQPITFRATSYPLVRLVCPHCEPDWETKYAKKATP